MTQPVQDKIWLTQEAFDKLKAELESLSGPVRHEIIERISAARDEGDLKENGGYHAAKDEQGKVEARIRQLEDMLRRAEVGEAKDTGVIDVGMKVTIKFVDEADSITFLLGAREIEEEGLDVYSPQSPLGQAVSGASKGDTVKVVLPTGKEREAKVLDAEVYKG